MKRRDFWNHPNFTPSFSTTNDETGETVEAPFPVAVLGTDQERTLLGVGLVIGAVETVVGATPIIEVEDIEDGEPFTLVGRECFWSYPVPPEVIDHIAEDRVAIGSVRRYLSE